MKILLMNGAPGSAKDTAVSYLNRVYNVFPFSFKTQLKAITLAIYGIPENTWNVWYSSREGKELPREELDGMSCRQAFIHVSENIIKPIFSKTYFGEMETRRLLRLRDAVVAAASDAGFNEEVEPLVEAFGAENVYVVYIQREGCSFEGDSRSWITTQSIPPENYLKIDNNGSLQELWGKLDYIYSQVLSK